MDKYRSTHTENKRSSDFNQHFYTKSIIRGLLYSLISQLWPSSKSTWTWTPTMQWQWIHSLFCPGGKWLETWHWAKFLLKKKNLILTGFVQTICVWLDLKQTSSSDVSQNVRKISQGQCMSTSLQGYSSAQGVVITVAAPNYPPDPDHTHWRYINQPTSC